MSAAPAVANPVVELVVKPLPINPGVAQAASSSTKQETKTTPNDSRGNESAMPKEERRRFKKLRKKAAKFRPDSDLSGLVKREEWDEAKETRVIVLAEEEKNDDSKNKDLQPKKDDFCPWVGRRRTKRLLEERDKVRDGFDHRLVLKSLHLQQKEKHAQLEPDDNETKEGDESRKRKREDSRRNGSFNIPKWVCVHNPVCVDHMAVLEVQIQGKELSVADVATVLTETPKILSPSSYKNEAYASQPLVPEGALISTEWFQGPRPQSISDVLLYEKPNPPSNKKPKPNSDTSPTAKLEDVMYTMILTQQEMEQEGYPTVISGQGGKAPTSRGEFRMPSSFSLDEAKAIAKQLHVTVEGEKNPFVMDKLQKNVNDDIRVFGLDCEMVKTDTGKTELGRLTLIQYINSKSTDTAEVTEKRYKVLLDELVLPYRPILDYVTQYSGLTAELLKDVTTRLEQIQASLMTIVRPQDILVGHSLENDLIATRWVHTTVIDTAVLFRSNATFKHSLKHLSNCLLKKRIQGGDHHCSEEDAATALELVIGRVEQGPTFAIHARDRLFWIPTEKKHNEAAVVFVGPSQWLQNHVTRHPNAMHALTCETIDSPNRKAVVSWLTGPKRRASLVWANLTVSTPDHLALLRELLVGAVRFISFSRRSESL